MSIFLQNRGITVFDPDSRDGTCTAVMGIEAGTIVLFKGTSAITIVANNSNIVNFQGTTAAIDAFFRGQTTGTISYSNSTPGDYTLTVQVFDEDGLLTTATHAVTVRNYLPPTVSVPAGTYTVINAVPNNLEGDGFTVTDSDDGGGYATMVFAVNSGTVSISPGNSGATVRSDNATASVTVMGTITSLRNLLTDVGTGTILWTPGGLGSKTITVTVTDSQGQVGTNNKSATVAAAPVVSAPSSFIPVVTSVSTNLHGLGFGVTDADAAGSTNVCTMAIAAPITIVAGNSGVTSITGSGTGLVTFAGTIAQLNNLLTGGGTGTIKVVNAVASTHPLTVSVVDSTGLASNVASVDVVFATGTVWTGYAQAALPSTSVTVAGFVAPIDLQNMPAAFWTVVAPDGRDIRVLTWDGSTETQVPCDIDPAAWDYANKKGMVYAKIQNSTSPPAVRVYAGATNATLPAHGATYGQDLTYDTSIIKGWWPAGSGVDRSSNGNTATFFGSLTTATQPVSGLATRYFSANYAKATAAIEDNIPEQFACFVNPTSVSSDMTYLGSTHGTIRNLLGQNNNKVRAKTDIDGGTDHQAYSLTSLAAGAWQLVAATFYSTTSRGAFIGSVGPGNDTGTSTGTAATDAYVFGGIGADGGSVVNVTGGLSGTVGLSFITKYAAVDASKYTAWVKNYATAYSQVSYWGTWAWQGGLSVTGLG